MGVKGKLRLLALLSIVAILSLTVIDLYNAYLYRSKITRIQKSVAYSSDLSTLLDAVQKERALSMIYLQSNGEMLASELDTQRAKSDDAIQTFQTRIAQSAASIQDPALRDKIDSISKMLVQIKTMRRSLDTLHIDRDKLFAYYNAIDDAILSILRYNAFHSPQGEVAQQLQTYYFLLSAKEIASREQALFAATLISERMENPTLQRVVSLMAQEQTYLEVFDNLAPQPLHTLYHSSQVQRLFTDTKKMTQTALAQAQRGDLQIDLQRWFGMITQKNDLYDRLEKSAFTLIQKRINQKPTLALYSALLGLVFLLIILWVLRSLNKEISRRIHTFDWIIEE